MLTRGEPRDVEIGSARITHGEGGVQRDRQPCNQQKCCEQDQWEFDQWIWRCLIFAHGSTWISVVDSASASGGSSAISASGAGSGMGRGMSESAARRRPTELKRR